MHSPDLFCLMGIKKLFVPLFKSNSLATMVSMILSPEKVGTAVITHSCTKYAANRTNTGLGFIMLLSGDPGVGKTLTAESGQFTLFHN